MPYMKYLTPQQWKKLSERDRGLRVETFILMMKRADRLYKKVDLKRSAQLIEFIDDHIILDDFREMRLEDVILFSAYELIELTEVFEPHELFEFYNEN